ncbi:DsbA family oxidoreductase [Gracilibacillus alcaliphilus]|uniref:DsbA family oxidoreductase n=1 Tax=Gracilibacillus alcaliphilus TaxID=1401441 RepID=UPI00195ED079|nr:DsbA family oxidoreductase [Gracilibacillus alcaliphilus]MBM7678183.1 putative DsbA family dithiol-disulfide isomerase [Gracilibacillus alcaliphilus]
MQIEIWSDFVCPFCYIGTRRLEQAIERFPKELDITITYKSFELDPQAPNYDGKSIYESLAEKYNMSINQAKQTTQQIKEQAAAVGLKFEFDTMKQGNTFHAHRLSKYAASINKGKEYVEAVLYHYFTLSKDVSDKQTLIAITQELGFNQQDVKQIIDQQESYAEAVRQDQAEAQSLGITGVPFFVINHKYAISGAQSVETFMQAIEKVAEAEQQTLKPLDAKPGAFCDGDSCN